MSWNNCRNQESGTIARINSWVPQVGPHRVYTIWSRKLEGEREVPEGGMGRSIWKKVEGGKMRNSGCLCKQQSQQKELQALWPRLCTRRIKLGSGLLGGLSQGRNWPHMPGHMKLSPRTHTKVEGKDLLCEVALWSPHTQHSTCNTPTKCIFRSMKRHLMSKNENKAHETITCP